MEVLKTGKDTAGYSPLTEACPRRADRRRVARSGLLAAFLALTVLVALAGCSGSDVRREEAASSTEPIYWPKPPEPARIAYVRLIERPRDVGVKKGIFTRLVELVVGARVDAIVKPYGMTVDSAGRLIVADTALKRIHIFDVEKNRYSFIEDAGKRDFLSPIGVAVDDDDNIYMTDSMLGRVFVFNKKRKFLKSFDAGKRPTGIAYGKSGKLYVADTSSHRVNIFDTDGGKLGTVGGWGEGEGRFNLPVDVFTDGRGDVYVVDAMNYRIQIFNEDGEYVTSFGHHGDGTGDFGRPKGVAVDSDGNIYVTDALFDTVQIFDREGTYLLSFGSLGRQPGNLWLPSGLFIDGQDRIYVADSYNKRVQIFEYLGSGS